MTVWFVVIHFATWLGWKLNGPL